ncbi:alpha/beta-hydrolase [Mollisia scopiformis]|uniref:Alpha/beta-hydrolase n=1 Tax=Mollisia scopiformis TaxID=149040 RepID=A0A194XVL6_MOLSC|nr:alpha/beta-hydrolase [Mollisia scopiformis]KUJ24273.1 alpha/beta-hydrolase [Mollisia scopiformis]
MGSIHYEEPKLAPVPVEWTSSEASASEGNKLVVFHVHGGAFFQGSPQSYRSTTTQFASMTGGRVVSVDYRLAPQNPFPAGLLDVLLVYLSLLYPTESETPAVDARNIVFAGDSSGGTLLCSILQIILHTADYSTCQFRARRIHFPLPLPAGLSVISLPGDLLQSLPSHKENLVNDLYLNIPWSFPDYPACPIWPSNPPRSQHYGDLEIHSHPLVCSVMIKSWLGAPPFWISSGEEQFLDGGKAVARRAASQGVGVSWTVYEAMPHCFSMLPGLNQSAQSKLIMKKWAQFCKECVLSPNSFKGRVRASKVDFRTVTETQVAFEDPRDLPINEIEGLILRKILDLEREFTGAWKAKTCSNL